ncbi:MAG: hypothetical protein M3552_17750, partial [Planctomycetota bacterium]|nr:hypothetical protein [Planctomycetota bacterium]
LQNTSNYRYWRMRSLAESRTETTLAHREIYDGQQLFKEGKLPQAQEKLLSGLEKLETVFESHTGFAEDSLAVEEVLLAMIYLRAIYALNSEEMPTDLPLQRVWDNSDESQIEELERQFRRQTSSGLLG